MELEIDGRNDRRKNKWTEAEEDDEWRKRGKQPPPPARRLERRLDPFLFYLSGFQLIESLFHFEEFVFPSDMDGSANRPYGWHMQRDLKRILRAVSYVASGNSFNASLFLFRDYPKEVDRRRPTKRKGGRKKKKKGRR